MFQDLDRLSQEQMPKPGDVLLGYGVSDTGASLEGYSEQPVHILFVSGRSVVSGWQGIGLWNMGHPTLHPHELPLCTLQRACDRNHTPIKFKVGALSAVLKSLHAPQVVKSIPIKQF